MSGNGENEQVVLLRGIWNELKVVNERVNTLRVDLKAEIGTLREETRAGFADVRSELATVNARLDTTNGELADVRGELAGLRTELKAEIGALREETRAGLATFGARFDNVLLGEHRREHGDLRERVARLEALAGVKP